MGNNTSLNVLVVDDSLIIRRNISNILEELGHTVVSEATNGQEAITMYKEYKPDVVTMDITMPDMNGIDALELIRDFSPDVKIIMMTAHGQEDMVIKAIKAGAKAYILKPVTSIKVVESINKLFKQNLTQEHIGDDLGEFKEIDDDFTM